MSELPLYNPPATSSSPIKSCGIAVAMLLTLAALSGALDCSSSTSSMSSAALLSPRGEPVTLISRSVAPCTSSLMEILEPDCSRMPLMLMPPFPMIVPCGGRRSSESGRVRDPGPRAE